MLMQKSARLGKTEKAKIKAKLIQPSWQLAERGNITLPHAVKSHHLFLVD